MVRAEWATTHRFFGRRDELERLRQISSEVIAGRSVLAIVSGAAGMGKSSLLAQLGSDCPPGFAHQLSIRCSELDASPIEPLQALARTALGEAAAPSQRLKPWAYIVRTADLESPRRLSRSIVVDLTEKLTGRLTGPSLLVIDDLHWAGEPVLDFVELLVAAMAAGADQPLLLVLLSRPVPPEHRLSGRLDRFNGDLPVHHFELDAIDEAADADLIRACAPGASTALVNYVRRAASGNPLMTLAMMEMLRNRAMPEDLRAADPRSWQTYVPDADGGDPLQRWLDELPAGLGRACRCFAAIGDDFTAGTAAVAVARSESQAMAALDAAVASKVLACAGLTYWFRHDLYREYLYRSLPVSRRRAVHTRLAAAALAGGDAKPQPSAAIRLARHLLNGSSELVATPGAATALRDGARAALSVTSWAEAARFHEAHLAVTGPARDGGGAIAGQEAVLARFDLLFETGIAHYFNHDLGAAVDRLRQAIAVGKTLDDTRWAAALVPLLRIGNAGDPAALHRPAAVPELDEFLAEPREQLPLARVIQVRSESLITAGLVDDGEIEAARALDLAERGGDRLTVATAGLAHGFAALARASPWDAIGRLEPALDAARSTGDWYIQNTIETRLAFAQCTAGHLKEAEVVAEAAAAVATANHEFSNRALAHATAGTVAYLRGDFRYSSRLLETAASEGRRAAYAPMVLFVLAAQVLGLFATGARDQAWHAIESANDLPRSLRRALRAVVGRDPGGGPPAERFKGITDLNVGIAAATVTARSELVPGDLGAIVELFEQAIDGGLAFPATVPISVHRALGRTLTLQGRLQAARDQLAEAERLCRSEDAFCELTLALLQAAQLDDRLGRREQSLRQALAAQRLAQRLGMPLAMAAARCVNAEGRAATTVHPPQRLILVSDIVGSTAVSHELGDRAYFDLVMEHHGIVRQLLAAYDGTEFSEGGDSLLAWFESTSEAIDCARAIQAQAAARRRIGSNLAIRIGIAGGDPFFSHGRPYGAVVNRAARLATKARPHQIVMDEATANSADTAGRLVQTQVMSLRGMGPVTVGILDR